MCSIFRVRKQSSSANDMGSVKENCYRYLLANKVLEIAQNRYRQGKIKADLQKRERD
jgi:hypothetical protein